jgi:2-oxoglutarate dehydrogenase E1 component
MQNDKMNSWSDSSHLEGGQEYIEMMYDAYLEDPHSVDAQWQQYFSSLPSVSSAKEVSHKAVKEEFLAQAKSSQAAVSAASNDPQQEKVYELIEAYRHYGHQHAQLDPLELWQRPHAAVLEPSFYGFSDADMNKSFQVGSFSNLHCSMTLAELIKDLRQTYCHHLGVEFMHVNNSEQRQWLQERFEKRRGVIQTDFKIQSRLYDSLNAAEGLEKYIAVKFPGAKRFSLEGGDSLIPMLREMVHYASGQGVKEVVFGMAHRGRLNVLINIMGKKSQDLFDEFAGKSVEKVGSGDVKYHLGYSSEFVTEHGNVHLGLAFNPSHLEIVNPVVMGSVRSRLDRRQCTDGSEVLPVTIHGDSAIAGQGIVQETFNMSQARGFKVGGSVRIVVNNQVGFTTSRPDDIRSTMYCTDVAKMVHAPVIHVNGDHPEEVAYAIHLAIDFRMKFKRDVIIDLVCYRRHGHNEADEPNATQPLMYQKIKKHPTTRHLYGKALVAQGVLTDADLSSRQSAYRDLLDAGARTSPEWLQAENAAEIWTPFIGHTWKKEYDNTLSKDMILQLAEKISKVPSSFKMHSRVQKIYADRHLMASGEKLMDWGFAENMAYASLLNEGHRVRLVGQDSGRGTFFHRHAVVHHQNEQDAYMPLKHIASNQGPVEIFDSVLSEASVVAFEYGYATAEPRGLMIWEAQFGDFANGAQVVIDQFLSSGEQKWGRLCGLTLLLPHGYEGQGPEHSSARLERFLQLCADYNMQVCIPSTPAQVYHMLRRQVVRPLRRPLVVMSPKSLLRHPMAVSSLEELSQKHYLNVIDEVDPSIRTQAKSVIFCSGKVYYDLLEKRQSANIHDVALVRLEQLYPFPHDEMLAIFKQYDQVTDFVWCQEEPKNQGAWYCSQHHFIEAMPLKAKLRYAGRPASASPAAGYASLHAQQQTDLVNEALGLSK